MKTGRSVLGNEVSVGAARLNEQLHYVFDPAGNLAYRTNNTLTENFQVNKLNELTNNSNSGNVTVVGTTTTQNSNVVTVNISNAVVYGDATFAATNMPFTTNYTAVASDSLGRRATNTVTVSIAANNALFQYDGNGNLIYDGLRSFTYDDENQLIQVCVTNQWLTQFAYDGKMRRRIRQECASQNGVWVQTNEVYYVYDGNLVIQERDVNNLPTTTYTRGKDLSGSLQGAGGIGGLLARTDHSSLATPHSFYHCDGNGNVTMLINDSQAIVAKYLYDAFGNILSKSGLLADANLYRFSSKEAHPNSGLVYYLYRYYDPNLQRWLNTDPIGESGFEVLRFERNKSSRLMALLGQMGGVNLYGFVQNQPTGSYDPLGLAPSTGPNSIACESALEQAEAALATAQKNPTAANIAAARAALNKAVAACADPPDPPPKPPSNPPWCPAPRWNYPYTPPNQQQCTTMTVGGVILIFCIPWPGNPVFGGL